MSDAASTSAAFGRALPLFLTREKKYPVGWAMFAFAAGVYLIVNHFHFTPPQELPRSWIDLAVPFLPNSFWIYLSEYLFFTAIYMTSSDMTNLNKFVYSFVVLQITSCLIFWFWPTTYPRALFPLPDDLNTLTRYAFSSLRTTDTPASCCPSLHVSSCYLSTFLYIDEQRKYFPLFFIWATAIAISTLTTKQHYLVDVIAGFFMAVAHYWVFHRWMQYRKTV
jgi:membrane-associated phospholipid phosphatase